MSPEDIENALDAVFDGRYTIEQRAVIAMTLDGETYHGYPYALNEVAILKHDNSSLIEIDTHINGALLTNYMLGRPHHQHADWFHRIFPQCRRPHHRAALWHFLPVARCIT